MKALRPLLTLGQYYIGPGPGPNAFAALQLPTTLVAIPCMSIAAVIGMRVCRLVKWLLFAGVQGIVAVMLSSVAGGVATRVMLNPKISTVLFTHRGVY